MQASRNRNIVNDEDDVPSADEDIHGSMRHSLGIDPLMD